MTCTVVKEKELQAILHGPPASSDSSQHDIKATLVADTHCILGECVLYDDTQHTILWTDIDAKAIFRLQLTNFSLMRVELPKMLGAFCLTNKRNVCLCGWEDGFQLVNITTGETLSEYSQGPPLNPDGLPSRLNDGRCDPLGERFICGGFFGDMQHVRMKVFCCRQDLQGKLVHEPVHDNVRITNSLCFSPDGETMYFCDSPTKRIQQYDYKNGKITLKNECVWEWTEEVGFPDGSCVDDEGYIWNALWRKGAGPGRIHRIHPTTGHVDYTVHMPDTTSQCTCVCFGGKDLDVLFITTASIDRDALLEPNAGGLYAVKVPFRGQSESRFQIKRMKK